jgi:hypothetical protein
LCGMQSRDNHCSTRDETGSETAVEQLSQQVKIASSTIPLELCDEYSTPNDGQDLQKVQETLCKDTVNDEDEDIVISEKAARAIKGEAEFAFLGEEFTFTEEIKPVICDGGATSTLSSSFENCTDCQPKTVEIKTAEGGVVMTTTHVCMKTYYVKSRTGDIRPITTKAFIVPSLRSDLISVKFFNRQGYRVVHDPDPRGIRNISDIQWENRQIEIFCIYE